MNTTKSITMVVVMIAILCVAHSASAQSDPTTVQSPTSAQTAAPPSTAPAPNALPPENARPVAPEGPIGPAGTPPRTDAGMPDSKDAPGTFSERNPRYRVQPGDSFEVIFSFTPDLNQTVAIQPDGFVTLKEVGDLNVRGKTVAEVTTAVKEAYSKILRDPQIAVVLKDFDKPHIIVGGHVGRPGKYELRSATTAAEAVQVAGGLLTSAKHSQVLLFRRVSEDWVQVTKLNLKDIYKGDFKEDVHLRAGDMLFVPQNRLSKVSQYIPRWGLTGYFPGMR